jgi:Ni/Co efflux regulator RcnB
MKKLLITIAAAALVAVPLAAHAQDRDGWQGDGRDGAARPAAGYGHDADARAPDDRRGDARYARVNRDRYGRGGVARARVGRDRFDSGRGFYSDRDDGRFRGEVGIGLGYGGYGAYGGYGGYDGGYYDAGAYPAGGYGADDAYSYPDEYGTYQPFDYAYSNRDDTYYADDGGAASGGEAYDRYQSAPNAGWSRGAGQDCGQWVWREGRGAYQWVPAPCR